MVFSHVSSGTLECVGPRLKPETWGEDRSSSTESQVVVTWVVEAGRGEII